ncbi:MAG TPA: hypothetical protein VG294_06365 [Solirubrobacteraceae bacterium]|nr:hypothetical protein [Solirubrobacteraceae bacterium]
MRGLPVFISARARWDASVVAGGGRGGLRPIEGRMLAMFGARRRRAIERSVAAIPPSGPVHLPALPPAPAAQENDLAALLIVAGATSPTGEGKRRATFAGAGALALDLLRHAVAGGGCAPQLNLAFLWAADSFLADVAARAAYAKAIAACPGDPTPLWALGEYQLQLDGLGDDADGDHALFDTFRRLERTFPRVAASWAGEGDAQMVAGYQLQVSEPFTARAHFARARALYERAVRLEPNAENRAGLARSLAALGDVGAAIAAQRRAVAAEPGPAELEVRLLDYLQRGHRFLAAAAVAAKLTSGHSFPIGVELFASPPTDNPVATEDQNGDEDVAGPLSTGVGRMEPAEIVVIPHDVVAAGATVVNLSFLPVFTPMDGIGGTARWCPAWSRLVDLLLAGYPRQVVSGFPRHLVDLRPDGQDCASVLDNGPRDLVRVAELELGDVAGAVRMSPHTSLAELEDLRQNLWRYAGKLADAAAAAAQWAATQPSNPVATQREGEIAFLRKGYSGAANYFAIAANRARLRYRRPSLAEATALLDQGTALAYARRSAEALATLGAANAQAADAGNAELSALASEQAGDTLLASGDPLRATEYYGVATDAESSDYTVLPQAVPLLPDALLNNEAIADILTGDPATAVTPAVEAVKIDPGDPIFSWTEAEAEQQLGHRAQAISDYRTALALDPTEFPVANNLGVLLMKEGNDAAAVAALRRSVGANRDYATGWFNLGVALERMGPLHVAASEGSLARARQLDSGLASREPVPLFDNVTYHTHLDLSKPLPAN